jgi:hypothetical protein
MPKSYEQIINDCTSYFHEKYVIISCSFNHFLNFLFIHTQRLFTQNVVARFCAGQHGIDVLAVEVPFAIGAKQQTVEGDIILGIQ